MRRLTIDNLRATMVDPQTKKVVLTVYAQRDYRPQRRHVIRLIDAKGRRAEYSVEGLRFTNGLVHFFAERFLTEGATCETR